MITSKNNKKENPKILRQAVIYSGRGFLIDGYSFCWS